jgi:uncharacterized surface protein with fasciclin (FAS1) repeats
MSDSYSMSMKSGPLTDLVSTADAAGDFSTLVAAINAAGLVTALQGPGPFTVFAPTDAAFSELPAGTVDYLLFPGNKDQLRTFLLYHVVVAELDSKALVDLEGLELEMLNGETVAISVMMDGTVMVNEANVVMADVMASNGVIHAIDMVLTPS